MRSEARQPFSCLTHGNSAHTSPPTTAPPPPHRSCLLEVGHGPAQAGQGRQHRAGLPPAARRRAAAQVRPGVGPCRGGPWLSRAALSAPVGPLGDPWLGKLHGMHLCGLFILSHQCKPPSPARLVSPTGGRRTTGGQRHCCWRRTPWVCACSRCEAATARALMQPTRRKRSSVRAVWMTRRNDA